jgi:5-oxoprolinase (ATP-hydrolysing)
MPVHLGSMSESIKHRDRAQPGHAAGRRVRAERPVPRRHAPARRDRGHAGVSTAGDEPALLLRRQPRPPCRHRRHHAGLDAAVQPKTIDEEGVLFDNFLLVRDGRLREAELRRSAGRARWPARNPDQTMADLRAQIAANEKGVQELQAMVAQFGRDTVAGLHAPRAGQRRGIGAPRHHRAEGRRFELPLDNGARHRGAGHRRRGRARAPPSTSPAPARSSPTTSTRPRR